MTEAGREKRNSFHSMSVVVRVAKDCFMLKKIHFLALEIANLSSFSSQINGWEKEKRPISKDNRTIFYSHTAWSSRDCEAAAYRQCIQSRTPYTPSVPHAE